MQYKTRHCWLEIKELHQFDHYTKWYMHKPESILENDTNKIHWDFEIQAGLLFSDRRLDLVLINKYENFSSCEFNCPQSENNFSDHRVKIKDSEKRQVLEPC